MLCRDCPCWNREREWDVTAGVCENPLSEYYEEETQCWCSCSLHDEDDD
jgi:hypothetical protein